MRAGAAYEGLDFDKLIKGYIVTEDGLIHTFEGADAYTWRQFAIPLVRQVAKQALRMELWDVLADAEQDLPAKYWLVDMLHDLGVSLDGKLYYSLESVTQPETF